MKSILAGLALIAAASSASAATTQGAYRCGDGSTLRAVFSAPGPASTVKLTFAGNKQVVTLPQVLSADGGRYAEGNLEFWVKGNTARLTRAGAETQCKTR